PLRILAASAVALSAGASGLLLAGPRVVVPFVYTSVLFVSLLTTLPLAALLNGLLLRRRALIVAGVAVGALSWVVTSAWGFNAGRWLEESNAGFGMRLLVRTCWCLGLSFPWFMALYGSSRPRPVELAVVSALALIIQGVYVSRVCDARTRDLVEILGRNET